MQETVCLLDAELEHHLAERTLQLERAVERASQLEEANQELESFAYSVSHDLSAPLRAVEGYASILEAQQGEKLDPDNRRLLEGILSESHRMGQLIRDLLAFSRLGRQPMHVAPIDMGAVVREVFAGLAAQVPHRRLRFVMEPLPLADGDLSMVRQVWVNLLSNAIKFTQHRDVAEIQVGCATGDEGDVFYIKDNGAGFDPKYAHQLFQAFQRLHSQKEFAGTGVGLTLVQRIIHRHGGRIWAEGKVDGGAVFHFTLGPVRK
jgi:two-component system sensor kinase